MAVQNPASDGVVPTALLPAGMSGGDAIVVSGLTAGRTTDGHFAAQPAGRSVVQEVRVEHDVDEPHPCQVALCGGLVDGASGEPVPHVAELDHENLGLDAIVAGLLGRLA